MHTDEVTTMDEDRTFERYCRAKYYTFIGIMEYLRRPNFSAFRESVINNDIPNDLRIQVEIQCKLEGLI